MKKGQSNRLTVQQKEGQGPITINLSLNFPCLHLDTERTYIREKLTKL